jgi:hypothetical protein
MGLKALLLVLFIFFQLSAYAAEEAKPIFDKRSWVLGWSKNKNASGTGQAVFDEYILKGEAIEDWSELITIQFFPGLNTRISLSDYELALKNVIINTCSGAKWNSFEQEENERSWQFTIKNCQGQPDQSELVRAVKTSEGIHVFHYAIKKAPMPESVKKEWIINLKSIKINKGPVWKRVKRVELIENNARMVR